MYEMLTVLALQRPLGKMYFSTEAHRLHNSSREHSFAAFGYLEPDIINYVVRGGFWFLTSRTT